MECSGVAAVLHEQHGKVVVRSHAAGCKRQRDNIQSSADRKSLLHRRAADEFALTDHTSTVSKPSALTMLDVQARGKELMDGYACDLRFIFG
ncbi:hypothetical protein ACOSQ2_028204 [Xanthoceras sorbifolium]